MNSAAPKASGLNELLGTGPERKTMDNDQLYTLIASIGDDAKTVLITYLLLDYGTLLVFFGLVTWGVRTVWKNRSTL